MRRCLKVKCFSITVAWGSVQINLMRETIKIQSEVKELLMWENPSSQTNHKKIYGKDQANKKRLSSTN